MTFTKWYVSEVYNWIYLVTHRYPGNDHTGEHIHYPPTPSPLNFLVVYKARWNCHQGRNVSKGTEGGNEDASKGQRETTLTVLQGHMRNPEKDV